MARTDVFDLGGLRLAPGEGRRLALEVVQEPLELAGEVYAVEPALVGVMLEISRLLGGGFALRIGGIGIFHFNADDGRHYLVDEIGEALGGINGGLDLGLHFMGRRYEHGRG